MKKNHFHIDQELLVKYLSNEVTSDEILIIERWLNNSPENREEYEEFKKIWESSTEIGDFESIDREKDWIKVKTKITFSDETQKSVKALYPSVSKSFFHYFSRVAAMVLIVSGVAFLLYVSFDKSNVEMISYETMVGEEKEVDLPDGSKVFLNSNSKISYSSDFKKNRSLELQGEGFFEVVKNPAFPFRVVSGNTLTEVLGTSFNLNNKNNRQIVVTLLTGRVSFYNNQDTKEKVVLEPGERATFKEGKITKEVNMNPNVISWKMNKLLFEDAKMTEVISNIQDYFDVTIEVQNATLYNCRYSGSFTDPELENLLAVIQNTLDVSFERRGEKYVLIGTGCQ